ASTAPQAGRTGGILRFGQSAADVGTLDPHFASGTQDRSLVDMVFNALIRFKPGDGTQFEPDLAESLPEPKTDAGKQTWTFTLRKGVMCQPTDGVPAYELTSDDVVYSLQKSADKDRSAYAGDYSGMKVEAVDASTVKVTLDSPLSKALLFPKLANYSGGYVLCRKAAEKLGANGLKTHPVGTGPFTFKRYSPKEKVELVANDAYFRGKPQLDGIDFMYMPDLTSRELGLLGGQLDVANGTADIAWVQKMEANPDAKVDIFGVGEVVTINFNARIPPLDKLPVRQAIAYALDRAEFQALTGARVSEPVFSPVPAQFMPGGLTQQEVAAKGLEYKTDREKAKKLLADAGLGSGFSLSMVTSELPSYRVVYESMQAQLAKVGIKIDLKVVDHASMHSTIRMDTNPIVVYVAFRPNADVYLSQFFHSDAIVVSGKKPNTNFSHYASVDALIDQARSDADTAKQTSLWKDAQTRILQDMAAYPVMFTNQVYARKKTVDYGHELKSVLALYPGIDETTKLAKK
ncbi:MAG: ABC transporter substrate-binding protein, partial [Candidatus Limnocylindria bacterium]